MIKIGALIQNGEHRVSTIESGSFEDAISDGVRTRTVKNIYTCLKSEVRDVIASLETRPAALLSEGGRNPDGTPALDINWGADYVAAGNDVSEISPNFSRVVAKYIATDPAGGVGQARTAATSGGIIGKPWENGERFAEMPESGKVSEDRVYTDGAWARTRTIDYVIMCLKTDARTVADAVETEPAALTTRGIDWGAGYELLNMYGQPISPSFYVITAKYRQVLADPEAPAQITQYAGSNVIGKPWESGLIYAETIASGRLTDDRLYLNYSFGWNRVRTVDKTLICLLADMRTVVDGLDPAPANLQTNPSNSSAMDWGGDYDLIGLSAAPMGQAFVQITAKYRRNIAEAIVVPPAGVELACTDGVCTITWQDVLFESLASGNALTTGLDVSLDGYTISMYCNGVKFSEFTPSASSGDKILEWETTATKAQLLFCGEIWKEYDV